MRVAVAILWFFSLFHYACAGDGQKSAEKKEPLPAEHLVEIKGKVPAPSCMSAEEEAATDYKDDVLAPKMWHGASGIVNTLSEPPLLKTPSLAEVRAAIGDAFRRIPKRGRWFKSYTASKPAKIYESPNPKSLEMGRLLPQTRVAPTGFVKGVGCKGGWLRIAMKGYVCLKHFKADRRLPTTDVLPVMQKGSGVTPGKYAYVRVGGAPWYGHRSKVKAGKKGGDLAAGFFVRFKRFTRINGKNYWKTMRNRYIPVDRLARFHPSSHRGATLSKDLPLPVLFPIAKDNKGKGFNIPVYDKPRGQVVARLKYHQAVHIYGEKRAGNAKYYRIGTCRWVASRQVAAAFASPVPPGVRRGEQWIDINLMRQTLVAYEGNRPIFATIISTGKGGHSTRHGIFRVWWKVPEIDMKNEVGASDEYLASAVPWTQFFWKGQALHGAYWHDDFGKRKSHGCVNLSPKDARFLYEWTLPYLGAGWKYRWTGTTYPGVTIQVRRDDEDRPMVWGIARNFIPQEQLAKLDVRYKNDIKKETLDIIKGKEGDEDPKQAGERTNPLLKKKGDDTSSELPAPTEIARDEPEKSPKGSRKGLTKKTRRARRRRTPAKGRLSARPGRRSGRRRANVKPRRRPRRRRAGR